ncbi:Uncharacterized protein APZ42_023309 [Daphnia magna]|uniref:Uncharacterized protein n=1 Tax=Daphnia magna TaxID=35525 RepID=A0A162DHP6_9CRUS|nr:Uncharacterized protein APZ42_023309 [Daphnia magna]
MQSFFIMSTIFRFVALSRRWLSQFSILFCFPFACAVCLFTTDSTAIC